MLGQLEGQAGTVVADFEAGLGTLSRLKPGQLDVLLVVADPTVKALEVAGRALSMIREGGLGRALVVANRLSGEGDAARVREALPGTEVEAVPEDPRLREADAQGRAPFDLVPDAPAVRAVEALAARLS